MLQVAQLWDAIGSDWDVPEGDGDALLKDKGGGEDREGDELDTWPHRQPKVAPCPLLDELIPVKFSKNKGYTCWRLF